MSTYGWAKWSTASIGIEGFRTCTQAELVYEHFRMKGKHLALRVEKYLKDLGNTDARSLPWKTI